MADSCLESVAFLLMARFGVAPITLSSSLGFLTRVLDSDGLFSRVAEEEVGFVVCWVLTLPPLVDRNYLRRLI